MGITPQHLPLLFVAWIDLSLYLCGCRTLSRRLWIVCVFGYYSRAQSSFLPKKGGDHSISEARSWIHCLLRAALVRGSRSEQSTADVIQSFWLSKEWFLLLGSCHWSIWLDLKLILVLLVTLIKNHSFSFLKLRYRNFFIFMVNNV